MMKGSALKCCMDIEVCRPTPPPPPQGEGGGYIRRVYGGVANTHAGFCVGTACLLVVLWLGRLRLRLTAPTGFALRERKCGLQVWRECDGAGFSGWCAEAHPRGVMVRAVTASPNRPYEAALSPREGLICLIVNSS